jgi:acetyl-CoA acyltransferase
MKTVVIAEYVRSPFTPAYKGSFARVRPDEIAAQVVEGLIKKTKIDPELIEDLIMGCAFPEGEQGFNIARLVGFLAGLPQSVAGVTVLQCNQFIWLLVIFKWVLVMHLFAQE